MIISLENRDLTQHPLPYSISHHIPRSTEKESSSTPTRSSTYDRYSLRYSLGDSPRMSIARVCEVWLWWESGERTPVWYLGEKISESDENGDGQQEL
jgi:hypothetical protein